MTVGEYVAKFEELSRYSNYTQNQPNEEWLTTKFESGLKPELKSMIIGHQIRNFSSLINRCRDIEASMKEAKDVRDRALNLRRSDDNNRGRFSRVQNSGNNFASKGGKTNAGRTNSQIHVCPKCKKNHAGECLAGRGVCFKCGKPGHMLRNCPQNQGQNSANQPTTRGRVFTLDGQKAAQASNLVQGTGLIQDSLITVLFDSRASHSFIYSSSAQKLKLPISILPSYLEIFLSIGEKIITSQVCKNCPLQVKEKEFRIDLVCLPMIDIDVVLGMNWLSANCVVIDCQNKNIIFTKESKLPNESLFLSTSQLRKSLLDGAQGYVLFNLSKAKVKPDALSRKFLHMSYLMVKEMELLEKFRDMRLSVTVLPRSLGISEIRIENELVNEVKETQQEDLSLEKILKKEGFTKEDDGLVKFQGRIVIPRKEELMKEILNEAHSSKFTVHPDIPEWKWESVATDSVMGLPRTQEEFDAIWIEILDLLLDFGDPCSKPSGLS
ncbi:uncharacterized protein LOC133294231 [Gastrolobium bilobum]|uniref:uncharacterized protein LOC133294231 n=1 Tax=Gastrolobium bilobum TaxID=150636 RepID=UPI002AB002A5|nr:uncharacterized protein LOC133294231 [Gastrolobium bilobum]